MSNLVAGLLVILLLFTLDRFQARQYLGELAVVSEARFFVGIGTVIRMVFVPFFFGGGLALFFLLQEIFEEFRAAFADFFGESKHSHL